MRAVRTLAMAGLLLLTGCASEAVADPPAPVAPGTLPGGWRWESYGGVQVGVPGDWQWAERGLRVDAFCIKAGEDQPPAVARPSGIVPAIYCGEGETLIENTGWVVGFQPTDPGAPDGTEVQDDRTTVRLAGVEVIVQAPPAWRERISATIHQVTVDHNGCPARHPISGSPAARPSNPVDITSLRAVTTVSACKYMLGAPAMLESSLRLDGAAAARAVEVIAAAPAGGGPDHADQCLPEVSYGDDTIVLRVGSAAGVSEIVVRYSGCDHRGFDDGVTVRSLTPPALAPFAGGPNAMTLPPELSGEPEPSSAGVETPR
ncbi:hypothetical protein GCM10010112_14020 [Actinoplanes lobatus]|uniref:Uncharacterized protein n=1 Tax=Actinoplanes lobatus TaxID=113568 RepID=A0A7W7HML0_9ACTN|nr:hypothetical protein [Actinoplanes lobatus]MBB4753236.1 hypothetical protein [Actinoplanes lobatus]GGN59273.1 hypothetical protein GCM10010112_14020 [Actinoplanes lobatus]GIE37768.1 hypothetical protein Alo02nite_06660 [Actinoplanes lobatus]